MNKKKDITKNIMSYVLVIVVAILIKIFIFSPVRVNGTSMKPTLLDGDIMILNEIGYKMNGVKRFDIVVANIDGEKLIKRVIGLPGEKIEYEDNKLYVNGEYVVENFKHEDTDDFSMSSLNAEVVPADCYLLLGDNRGNSKDSRILGFIPAGKIMGKTAFIVYPFDRIGSVQ